MKMSLRYLTKDGSHLDWTFLTVSNYHRAAGVKALI